MIKSNDKVYQILTKRFIFYNESCVRTFVRSWGISEEVLSEIQIAFPQPSLLDYLILISRESLVLAAYSINTIRIKITLNILSYIW